MTKSEVLHAELHKWRQQAGQQHYASFRTGYHDQESLKKMRAANNVASVFFATINISNERPATILPIR